jgi:AbrB family looped-hinge helix DNA binding protein
LRLDAALIQGEQAKACKSLPDIQIFLYSATTMEGLASKVDWHGTIVLPAKLRRRLGVGEGSFVMAEDREDGILIRPATVLPVEVYTSEHKVEFLLNNAVGAQDYRRARAKVKRMVSTQTESSIIGRQSAGRARSLLSRV